MLDRQAERSGCWKITIKLAKYPCVKSHNIKSGLVIAMNKHKQADLLVVTDLVSLELFSSRYNYF